MAEPVPPVPEQNEDTTITQAAPTAKQRRENPKFFHWLCILEFSIVVCVGLGIIGLAIYLTVWVVCEWQPSVHARLVQTIRGLNTGWKIALGILIPLFFRPAAKFLIHLKKAQGWESQEPAHGQESKVQEYRGDPPKN